MIFQRHPRAPFEDNQVIAALRRRIDNQRCAGNPNCHCLGRNLRSAGILFDIKKNRTAVQANAAAGSVETENCVLTQSRDR